ncbi:helix-turn-helix domain-containing protein [Sphaerisporangium dianthi]|uniref:Helix-turn-helix domain-containing protein n=1 Tax=Sphaerisporangium dianthi TaxID=1436120 RepID=A0ABV9C9J4_9ACTN
MRLGRELRRLREQARMAGDVVAARLEWSAAKVSRIETARTFPSLGDVERLVELYGADDAVRERAVELHRDAGRRRWWEEYRGAVPGAALELMDREAEARRARNWEPHIMPALLRTYDYERAVMAAIQPVEPIPATAVARRLEALMTRQKHLLDGSRSFALAAVVHVTALVRPLGDGRVMREQLDHLVEVAELDHVDVRILTEDTPHPLVAGPFVHLEFPDFPGVVHLEEIMGARFVEDAEQVHGYERAFDHLRSIALDEAASRRLVRDTAERWR